MSHLKRELKNKTNILQEIRHDHQKLTEAYDKIVKEYDNVRSTNKMNESHIKELNQLAERCRELHAENDSMKKSVSEELQNVWCVWKTIIN